MGMDDAMKSAAIRARHKRIEAVARDLARDDYEQDGPASAEADRYAESNWHEYADEAATAIKSVLDGLQAPTEKMLQAGRLVYLTGEPTAEEMWESMIDAAIMEFSDV